MNFGVPNQRRSSTKVEKYPNIPVATLVIAEKGKARSILLNEKAVEMLNLPDEDAQVAFSFDNGITILNADQDNIPEEIKINVTKASPRRFSDKKTYEYIIKSLDLSDEVENEFNLHADTIDGINVFNWVYIQEELVGRGNNEVATDEQEELVTESFNPNA